MFIGGFVTLMFLLLKMEFTHNFAAPIKHDLNCNQFLESGYVCLNTHKGDVSDVFRWGSVSYKYLTCYKQHFKWPNFSKIMLTVNPNDEPTANLIKAVKALWSENNSNRKGITLIPAKTASQNFTLRPILWGLYLQIKIICVKITLELLPTILDVK